MASRSSSTPLLRVLKAGGEGARSFSTTPCTLASLRAVPPSVNQELRQQEVSSILSRPLLPSSSAFLPPTEQPTPPLKLREPYFPSPLFPLPSIPQAAIDSSTRVPELQLAKFLDDLPPTPQSLAVILSRLNLANDDKTADLLLQAITHPSYEVDPKKNNLLLSEVGRSILGFVTSEYYGKKYPNLPTKALKLLMTALTNRDAMESVGSEVGLALASGKAFAKGVRRREMIKGGVAVRYKKWQEQREVEVTNQKHRTVKMTTKENSIKGRKGGAVYAQMETFVTSTYETDAIVSAVRAVIGLIYQEKGLPAAAAFINGHFISRQIDLPALLKFEQPFDVLKSSVFRYGMSLPVARLLKESGRHTASPYFVVGYFSDDIKLGEGFGKSLAMASHRAATSSLQTLYLASSPHPVLSIATLPPFPLSSPALLPTEAKYRSLAPQVGESESMRHSSGRAPESWQDPQLGEGEAKRGVETKQSWTGERGRGGEQERLMEMERS